MTILIVARGVSSSDQSRYSLVYALLLLLLSAPRLLPDLRGPRPGPRFHVLFHPERLGVEGVLDAMGQAFFTLSLGMGAIMAYGAYVPSNASITPPSLPLLCWTPS